MARTAAGKKASSKPSATTTSNSTTTTTTASGSNDTPPPPFTRAPDHLVKYFLHDLPKSHIYILHTDTSPRALKRRVFMVPVFMNIGIILLILLRAYYALPTYYLLLASTLGWSPKEQEAGDLGAGDLFSVTLNRTLMFFGDYSLFAFLGSWPWNFLFGNSASNYSSPIKWRLGLGGFEDREVVVRVSRRWDASLLPSWTLDDELTMKNKVVPAVSRESTEKTGMLLLDKDWDLDYGAMIRAHDLLDRKRYGIGWGDFGTSVVCWYASLGKTGGWIVWKVDGKDKEKTTQQRDTLMRFKDKLTKMGQEELFFRWVELVQFESSQPGGFTEGRQANAMREARKMFADKGVDFAKFWEEVGGAEGMPGLEKAERK